MGYYMDNAGNTYYTDTPNANAQTVSAPETYTDAWGNNVASTISPWNSSAEQERRYQMAMNYTPEEYQAALAREATYLTPGGVGGFGGFMNQNLNAANLSQYVEPINRYVGPMVLPAVMAAGGAMIGGPIGGMLIGGTLGTAVGAGIGASTYGAIDSVDKGDYLGAAAKVGTSILGAYAGGSLLGDAFSAAPGTGVDYTSLAGNAFAAPTLTVDPSLALNSGLMGGTEGMGAGWASSVPSSVGSTIAPFTADPTLANNVTLPSLTPDAIPAPTYGNALTPTPELQVNTALAPDADPFQVDPSLHAYSNTLPELDPNYKPSSGLDKYTNDAISKIAKGLLSGGNKANAALPTFQTNFTPLSSQAFGNTGNSWGTDTAGKITSKANSFTDSPFKGSFLMNGQDSDNLTQYLADYLPLNASKKMKDFSSFIA